MFNETENCFGVWKFVKGHSAISVKFQYEKNAKKLCMYYKAKKTKLCKNDRKK